MRLSLAMLGGLLAMSLVSAKDGPTYYTPQRIAVGKENAAREWGKNLCERMQKGDANTYYIGREYGAAADCIAQTDDFIWLMQPTTKIPRVVPNHDTNALCPVHGEEVRKQSAWTAWTTDPIHHPYKVRCRAKGEWYPSNDYMNGDMTSGDYPDDGTGCKVGDKRFYFLIEYAHMAYGNNTIPCLRSLSQAWLLTGDKRYARAGCILLARLASEYPNFTDRKDRLYFGPYGGRDPHYTWKTGGMITDLIWETFCLEATAYAYDGLWNYMDQDPEMIAFLKAKGMPVNDGSDLRHYIEENLLRVGMQGILNGHIHGNEGFHQAAAMACALVMDDYSDTHPNSQDMVDYAFHGDGRAAYMILNGVLRDGGSFESPNYSSIKFDFIRVNRLMEEIRRRQPDRFPKEKYPDLFGNPKGKAMFDYYIDIEIFHTFLPSIGDCGNIQPSARRKPAYYSYVTTPNLYGFERFRDPRIARACTNPEGRFHPGELFETYPEAELKAALEQPESQIKLRDRLTDAYGWALIETGQAPGQERALSLNYSGIPGHRQFDNLNLELFARGVSLLPDLGYPYTWDYRDWDSGIMSHNTVCVDETMPPTEIGGQCNLFAQRDGIHVVTARHDPYPPHYDTKGTTDPKPAHDVNLYERTSVLIELDESHFYVVDLFAVNGGSQHDQTWHGPLDPMQAPPLNWQAQDRGTLAGPDVAHAARYTDRWGRENTRNFPCYLTKVRRAQLTEPQTWHWDYGLPEQDQLNLHVIPVGGPAEVIMGSGRSPARPANWGLDYLLVRRQSRGQKPDHFLTVLDPFQQTPVVQSVRLVSEQPLTLEVTRNGAVDTIVLSTPDTTTRTSSHRPLGLSFKTTVGDQVIKQVQIGETAPGEGPGYATGKITATDYEAQGITVEAPADQQPDFAVDRYVRIFNERRSGMFRIVDAKPEGKLLRLKLDQTAHLGEGPVVNIKDGNIWVGAMLNFANGRYDAAGKALMTNDFFAGSWLGEGKDARQVKGAIRDTKSQILLQDAISRADLEKLYGGKVVRLWQYGVGDQVEIPRLK